MILHWLGLTAYNENDSAKVTSGFQVSLRHLLAVGNNDRASLRS